MHQRVFLILKLFRMPFRIRLTPTGDMLDDYIVLSEADVKSQIEYLSEYGILVSQKSSKERMGKVLIGVRRSVDSDGRRHGMPIMPGQGTDAFREPSKMPGTRFLIVDQTDEGGDSLDISTLRWPLDGQDGYRSGRFSKKYSAMPGNAKMAGQKSKDAASEHAEEISEDHSAPLKFLVSRSNFYLLKLTLDPRSKIGILMDYTEAESPPIALQLFLHLPLLITSIIIVMLVVTFETDIDKGMIAREISRLPVEKYAGSLDVQECPICLDTFCLGDEIRMLGCKHCFHRSCIDSWLVNLLKCPLCRSSVTRLADSPSYEIYQTITSL